MLDTLEVATATPERIRGRWSNARRECQIHAENVGKYAIWLRNALLALHENIPLSDVVKSDLAGWPEWVAVAVGLPPLTKDTALDWFKVGWKMLEDTAPGGDVTKIKELHPSGDSGAEYWKREEASLKIQNSQRANGIKKALREAFLVRWGN